MAKRFYFNAIVIVSFLFCLTPQRAKAWGPEGHAIVGRIAMRFITPEVRKNILSLLAGMSIDTAANWMDIMKSNPDYDFMRSWHYIDYAKDKSYQSSNDENLLNRLLITFNELQHKNTLCTEQVKTDLLILLHLVGDLHMPLHTGYDDDLGGNKRIVQYDTMKTHNLHRFWDEDIIRLTNITDESSLKLSGTSIDTTTKIDFVSWMNESRSLLPQVYDFSGFILSETYLQKNKLIVERQLLFAG
ncbi:MAG: S1/P1 nuclease, partial [Ferruginibacter sp.]